MPLELDLTTAAEGGFDALPTGNYTATIKKVEMKESSGRGKLDEGTPILNVGFEIDKDMIPEHPGKGKSYTSYVFKGYPIPGKDYEKHDQLMGILISMLKATGLWSDDELRSDKGFTLDEQDLLGARVIVKVSEREYVDDATDEKRTTNDVASVRPIQTRATADVV